MFRASHRALVRSSLIAFTLLGSALAANALDAPKSDTAKAGMPTDPKARRLIRKRATGSNSVIAPLR